MKIYHSLRYLNQDIHLVIKCELKCDKYRVIKLVHLFKLSFLYSYTHCRMQAKYSQLLLTTIPSICHLKTSDHGDFFLLQ